MTTSRPIFEIMMTREMTSTLQGVEDRCIEITPTGAIEGASSLAKVRFLHRYGAGFSTWYGRPSVADLLRFVLKIGIRALTDEEITTTQLDLLAEVDRRNREVAAERARQAHERRQQRRQREEALMAAGQGMVPAPTDVLPSPPSLH